MTTFTINYNRRSAGRMLPRIEKQVEALSAHEAVNALFEKEMSKGRSPILNLVSGPDGVKYGIRQLREIDRVELV